jgi:hypothetical protein
VESTTFVENCSNEILFFSQFLGATSSNGMAMDASQDN